MYLDLDLPNYNDSFHIIDMESLDEPIAEIFSGHYINCHAYIIREDNLGYFAQTVSHEMAHLFAHEKIVGKVGKIEAYNTVTLESLNSGIMFQWKKINLYQGLNEAITEMLAHYVLKYALENELIHLKKKEIKKSRYLTYAYGVHLLDDLLDRHARRNPEKRSEYCNDLFKAYLLGDLESALQALGASRSERKILRAIQTSEEAFVYARMILGLSKI